MIKKFISSLGIKAAQMVLSVGLAIMAARFLGAEVYGKYSYFIAIVTVAAVLARLGFPLLLLRETAGVGVGHHSACPAAIKKLWLFSFVVSAIAALIISFGVAWFYSSKYLVGYWYAYSLAGVTIFMLVAMSLLIGILQGLGGVIWSQFVEKIFKPAIIILVLLAGLYWRDLQVGSEWLVLCFNIAAFMSVLFLVRLVYTSSSPTLVGLPRDKSDHVSRDDYKKWLGMSYMLGGVLIFQVVNGNVDVLVLGALEDEHAVGVYKIALQGATLVIFALRAVNLVVMPEIVRAYRQKDMVGLQKVISKSTVFIAAVSIPVTLVFIVAGKHFLRIFFGEEFVAGYGVLVILSLGYVFVSLVGPVEMLLNMTGKEKQALGSMFIACVVNILLCLTLVPLLGINGAAIATAFSLLAWSAHMMYKVKLILGIDPTVFGCIRGISK